MAATPCTAAMAGDGWWGAARGCVVGVFAARDDSAAASQYAFDGFARLGVARERCILDALADFVAFGSLAECFVDVSGHDG